MSDGDDSGKDNRARKETLAIPKGVRDAVDLRDSFHCRVCGKHLGNMRALHHIHYGGARQGMGGRRDHDIKNLISVCWLWGDNCHDRVHANKQLWLPVLDQLVVTPGVTGMQLLRWSRKRR